MTPTSAVARGSRPAPAPPSAIPIHSHERCLALFDSFMDHLRSGGWTRLRLDTYVHPNQPRWTIKHQFCSGTWEIHLDRELDQGVDRTTVTINRYRQDLPTIFHLFNGLFRRAGAESLLEASR